jgi:hypothetical protein
MTDATTIDIDPSDEALVSEDKLDRIVRLARLQVEQQRAVIEAEKAFDRAKAALRRTEEADLPDALAAAHTSCWTGDSGEVIEIVREIHASIPKGREDEAITWMIDDGNGDNVKSTITLRLPRGAIDVLERISRSLRKFNGDLPTDEKFEMERKLSIHYQTLNKFVRDALTGEKPRTDLPEDLLGIFHRRYAKVTRPDQGAKL